MAITSSSMYWDQYVDTIAFVALSGIWIKIIFILWLVSFFAAPRNGDRARTGFTWLKALFPLWFLGMLLEVIGGALNIWYLILADDGSYYDDQLINRLSEAITRVLLVGNFFTEVSSILLVVVLVEIGNGFLFSLSGVRSTLQNAARYIALGFAFIVFALSVGRFGHMEQAWTPYYNYWNQDEEYTYSDSNNYEDIILNLQKAIKVDNQILSAFNIIMFVSAFPVIAYAAFVVHKCRTNSLLINSAILLLIATILSLVRNTWRLAYTATWLIPHLIDDSPDWTDIVTPLLDYWPMDVALVLLFVIGIRKRNGLWSSDQKWAGGATQTYVAGRYPSQGAVWQGQTQQVQYQQYPQQYPQQQYPQQQYPQQPYPQQPYPQQPYPQQQNPQQQNPQQQNPQQQNPQQHAP